VRQIVVSQEGVLHIELVIGTPRNVSGSDDECATTPHWGLVFCGVNEQACSGPSPDPRFFLPPRHQDTKRDKVKGNPEP
jgi:hypothetical protein